MQSKGKGKRFALVVATASLAGCGSLGLGTPEYGCRGMPEGVQCMSARSVYEQTDNRDDLQRMPSGATLGGASTTSAEASRGDSASLSGSAASAAMYPVPVIDDGRVPLRTPARVMRVLIGPWESINGDLHLGGLVYTEIEPRKWQVGLPAANNKAVIRPLDTPAP